MTIGLLTAELYISNALSLKQKRMVTKSLKDKLRRAFNVSVAEIGDQEMWQKAALGIVTIGTDKKYVNGTLDRIVDVLGSHRDADLLDYEIELL